MKPAFLKALLQKYNVIIVDIDGTLYYLHPLRLLLFISMGFFALLHPARIREFLIIKDYRRLFEKNLFTETGHYESQAYQTLSTKHRTSQEQIKKIIHFWMETYPLRFLTLLRDRRLLFILQQNITEGKTLIAYSDYPIGEKLSALTLDHAHSFHSDSPEIQCIKPNPAGLQNLLTLFKAPPEKVLYIGDRLKKDGKCALESSVDFLLLNQYSIFRYCWWQKASFFPFSNNSGSGSSTGKNAE